MSGWLRRTKENARELDRVTGAIATGTLASHVAGKNWTLCVPSCGKTPLQVGRLRPMLRENTASHVAGKNIPGSDLLSHAPTRAVPSAVAGLTSVFGMGTGVTLLLWPPGNLVSGVPLVRLLYGAQEGRPRAFLFPAFADYQIVN